jgi:uncharacterized delta-60 repeat protein
MNETAEPVGGSDGRRRTRRRSLFAVFVVLAAALAIIPLAGAASGDLDLSFGNQGTVIDPLEAVTTGDTGAGAVWAAHAVVFDPGTSQIFVVGSDQISPPPPGDTFNSSVAASFSSEGSRLWHMVIPPAGGPVSQSWGDAAVMHPLDGALVVAGLSTRVVAQGVTVLALYATRVAPDGTFLGTWERIISSTESSGFTSPNEVSVAVAPDGDIVVGAALQGPGVGDRNFVLTKFLWPDGRVDPNFGTNGLVTTDLGSDDVLRSLAVQADGKIVAAGNRLVAGSGAQNFAIVRYLPSGALDPTFGSGGVVTTAFEGIGRSVVVQPDDGKIVVGGSIPGGAMEVARFNPDGALDASFGNAGLALVSFCSSTDCQGGGAVALDTAHRIVIAGFALDAAGTFTSEGFAVARLLPDGSLDATFGTAGMVRTRLGNPTDRAYGRDVAIQTDGKIVVAGTVHSPETAGRSFGLARYLGPTTHTLTTAVNGQGSVSSLPPGIACPTDCSEAYAEGALVNLTASPAPGWTFMSWSGDCAATTCSLSMDQDHSVSATFVPVPTHVLTVAVSGQGSVASTPPGIACPADCSEIYAGGTLVNLTATPAFGWVFFGWSGGSCSGAATTCAVTMSQNQTVTATFNLGDCTRTGTPGNDVLTGTSGPDKICGLGGNDIINGLGGDDLLLGGPGNDNISAGAGLDRVDGGMGVDAIDGGAGNDRIAAAEGNDNVIGGAGNDDVTGGAGNDRIDGGLGDDRLEGDAGSDIVIGGAGDDTLTGGAGADALDGGAGRDTLQGQAGLDALLGGAGDDKLDGGPNIDLCSGGAGTDSGVACEIRIGIP